MKVGTEIIRGVECDVRRFDMNRDDELQQPLTARQLETILVKLLLVGAVIAVIVLLVVPSIRHSLQAQDAANRAANCAANAPLTTPINCPQP